MQFNAKFITFNPYLLDTEYWRTIHANDLREAEIIAKRYARKGYVCETIKQAA